jgi:Sec-independent protein secretion pathway component TatC
MSKLSMFAFSVWYAWILVTPMLISFFFYVKATAARESGISQLTKIEKRILKAIP